MAKFDIKEFNKSTLDKFKNTPYNVHINFETKELYDSYIAEGFDPADFEDRNNSTSSALEQIEKNGGDKVVQVLIKDKPYKTFNKENYVFPWIEITHMNFGKYSFDIEELGELLNELMEAKKASDKK